MALGPEQTRNKTGYWKQGAGNTRPHSREIRGRDASVRFFCPSRVELVLARKNDARLIATPSVTALVETTLAGGHIRPELSASTTLSIIIPLGFSTYPQLCPGLLCL